MNFAIYSNLNEARMFVTDLPADTPIQQILSCIHRSPHANRLTEDLLPNEGLSYGFEHVWPEWLHNEFQNAPTIYPIPDERPSFVTWDELRNLN